jgi:3-isopropylmalate/(R)-2-methylmalate dehydratase small subunit
MADELEGRVWIFGIDINTDLIIVAAVQFMTVPEMAPHCFSAIRPGWVDEVREGDILVAGRNFGVGSARAIGDVLMHLGIRCVIAESFNGLGMRNCINAALPVLPCPGITSIFEEGDIAQVAWATGEVRNATRGGSISGPPIPSMLQDIIRAGGVIKVLREEGYLAPAD